MFAVKKADSFNKPPVLSAEITRRDFIGTTLIGAGAALLGAPCPAAIRELGRAWTGYGGVGDYRYSNGNTAGVVSSAHKIRDHVGRFVTTAYFLIARVCSQRLFGT